jgi:hypothetical protein
MAANLIKEFVQLIVERRNRLRESEVMLSTGEYVAWGSQEHVADLQQRIDSLVMFRDSAPRGTDRRANYARLIGQLRAELRSIDRNSNPRTDNRPTIVDVDSGDPQGRL